MNDEVFKSDELKLVFQDALANEESDNILNLTTQKIKDIKRELFNELGMNANTIQTLDDKLKDYRFIDDITDFKEGSFIRWFSINDVTNINDVKLRKGSFISEIKMIDDDIHIVCKTFMNKYIQILGSKNLIFQKMSDQEQILLSVMDYIQK